MVVEGKSYPLKPFRQWLLSNHEQLCNGHFIKAVRLKDRTKFTYDWQHIYFLADQYQFTKQFTDEINSQSTGSVPGDLSGH